MTRAALWIASLARWAPALSYVIAIAIVGLLMHAQPKETPPPVPQATKKLEKNHKIEIGDLQTDATAALTGKFLTREIAAAKPVPADAVADKPVQPPIANTVAALVSMSVVERKAQNITKGQDVQVCLKKVPFGGPTKVLAVDCDEQVCAVMVKLSKPTPANIDPDAMADARLIDAASNCANTP